MNQPESQQPTPPQDADRLWRSFFVFIALMPLGICCAAVLLGVLASAAIISSELGSSHLAANAAITALLVYGLGWRLLIARSLPFTLSAIGAGFIFMVGATYGG